MSGVHFHDFEQIVVGINAFVHCQSPVCEEVVSIEALHELLDPSVEDCEVKEVG